MKPILNYLPNLSISIRPLNIPLTAFIVGDMMEYLSAHATYRFILRDEEEERGRILVSTIHWHVDLLKSLDPISQDMVIQTKHADIVFYYHQPCHPESGVYPSCEGVVQITWARRRVYRSKNVRSRLRLCWSSWNVVFCSILAKYPGFAQAEYLSYPMEICRRLAVILKETNSVYPDSMRRMAGLEVGWLCRSWNLSVSFHSSVHCYFVCELYPSFRSSDQCCFSE